MIHVVRLIEQPVAFSSLISLIPRQLFEGTEELGLELPIESTSFATTPDHLFHGLSELQGICLFQFLPFLDGLGALLFYRAVS